MHPATLSFEGLPGEEFAQAGLDDWKKGDETISALLMHIASMALERTGFTLPPMPQSELDAEIRLYRLLQPTHGNAAHSQYNSLLRRLVSFERALWQRYCRSAR